MNGNLYDVVAASRSVPAFSTRECSSWRLRNACEAAVMAKLGIISPTILDEIIGEEDFYSGAPKLANEFLEWRDICGLSSRYAKRAPDSALQGELPWRYSQCASLLNTLGLSLMSDRPDDMRTDTCSVAEGGPAAIERISLWRPTYPGRKGWRSIELKGVPSRLIRRSWFTTPDNRPVIVTTGAGMSTAQIDVWWGIHNGLHMDLLDTLGDRSLREAELGRGILQSEAMAMCLEILGALETLSGLMNFCRQTLGKGFVERANRLAWQEANDDYHMDQFEKGQTYWMELPKIAASYVIGPILMIGADFNNIESSKINCEALAERFRIVSATNEEAYYFVSGCREIFNSKP